jgi:phenylpyruvate tautomerase PptA (4-oxalocrotonate tautomerase family)
MREAPAVAMPLLSIQTSAPAPAESGALLGELSRELAGWLGKPERYVMTLLQADLPMTFAGDSAACAYVQVKSIGALGGDRPAAISAALCSLLAQRLGVDPDRIYISFDDVPGRLWGWDGSTFG